jgi:hypothetical protein
VAAVTGSALGASAAGATRYPLDGWEVSRTADNLLLTQGLVDGTGSSPSSATGAQPGSDGSSDGLLEDVTEAGAGATGIVGTPDAGTLAPGATTVTVPTLPPPPVPAPPTVPAPLPSVELEVPCVPVAPLTTC